MESLAQKNCIPCQMSCPKLNHEQIQKMLTRVIGWQNTNDHHITKTYTFRNFSQALSFVNVLGTIAEQEGHHPVIELSWGKINIKMWTHKIDGICENDFILAAKFDEAYNEWSKQSGTTE